MSFNIINILWSSKLSSFGLTLNQLFDFYDDYTDRCNHEPSIPQLEKYISFKLSDDNYSSDVFNESIPDSDWSFSSSSSTPEKSIEVLIDENYPEYRNDISFHKGYHWCSRDCEGAVFLCGNSYLNKNGGVTKCGYIARHYVAVPHVCNGHKELHFNSIDSRDVSIGPLNPSKKRRINKNRGSYSKYN
jgi:hypothetical protein